MQQHCNSLFNAPIPSESAAIQRASTTEQASNALDSSSIPADLILLASPPEQLRVPGNVQLPMQYFRQRYGPQFRFSSTTQYKAVALASLRVSPLLVVLPTGGGKSLVYEAIACKNLDITLVVSPFRALGEDIAARAVRNGISAKMWTTPDTPCTSIVVVVADSVPSEGFMTWLHK